MEPKRKSRVTLSAEDTDLLGLLQAKLEAKSKIEVIRRGLRLLEAATDREDLREAYRQASLATRESIHEELRELDG